MILSLLPVHTHTAQDMFLPGRNPLSTPMIPFRAYVLSGTGNGKPETMAGLPVLEGHDGERSGLPAPGWNQKRESMKR